MNTAHRDEVVAARIASVRAWVVASTTHDAEATNRSSVQPLARGKDQLSFLKMQLRVEALPAFSLARGVCSVLDGRNDAGWSEIRDSVQFMQWWWRGVLARAQKERIQLAGANIGMTYYAFSHACLLSLAISDAETAAWFAKHALEMVVDGTARASTLEMQFPEFVGGVCAAWLGAASPPLTTEPDASFDALAKWDNDAALTASLPSLLDYHLQRCDETSEANPDPSYQQPGLALLPTPAYAILALRRRVGRGDLPGVDHPLAALPTWTPPSSTVSSDGLLSLIAERVLRLESGKY